MRILFVGDIVGRSGRTVVVERLPKLVRDWKLDLVIANGENAAGGFGITEAIYRELIEAGVDAVTLGNHAWDQKEALVFIERAPRLVRPLNYPAGTPGRGAAMIEAKAGGRVLVINAMGRIYMDRSTIRSPRSIANSTSVRWPKARMRSSSISTARRPAKSRPWVFSATAGRASSSARTPTCRPPICACCPAAPRL